jgi:hypothetical protein
LRHGIRQGDDGKFDDAPVVSIVLPASTGARQCAAMLETIAPLFEPCGAEKASSALARIRALCARRNETDGDVAMIAAAYVDELRRYPADVVISVCREWPRASKWWPAWRELQERLDRAMATRCALRRALSERARAVEGFGEQIKMIEVKS